MKFSEYSINDLALALGYETEDIDVALTRELQTYIDSAKAEIREHTEKIDIELDDIAYMTVLLNMTCISMALNKSSEVDNSIRENPVFKRLWERCRKLNF